MMITHKTECFPSEAHKRFFERCFGMRRFFFNVSITELKRRYNRNLKENVKQIKTKEIMSLRKDLILAKYRELKLTVPDHILYTTMEDVVSSIDSLKRKGKDIKLRKKKQSNTFRICKSGPRTTFWYESGEKYIGLPQFTKHGLPKLKLAESIRWQNPNIRTVTIKREAGRYWIAITCEVDDSLFPKLKNQNRAIGLDWGLKNYVTGYDGREEILEADFDMVKLSKLDLKMRRAHKGLSRKVKYSKNWMKAKTKLQQAYLNLNHFRYAEIDAIVKYIADNYDVVIMESLKATFFSKNRKLSRLVALKPPYLLKMKLLNKLRQQGKKLYVVPSNFPSTQICNACGYRKVDDEKMKLGMHTYHCPHCGHVDDRDANAAKNIYSCRNLEEVISLEDE